MLLVEDEDLNVELFRDILSDEGHDVVVERDGLSGRARGLAQPFDLILLDLHVPGIDGAEVCRGLRQAGIKAPILAVSASAMADEIARAMPAGFNEYLTKPVTPAALRAAIARHAGAGAIGSAEDRR